MRDVDRKKMLERCGERCVQIAVVVGGRTWAGLWDGVMDLGSREVKGLCNLSRVLSSHGRGRQPCPWCEVMELENSLLGHLVERHGGRLRDLDEDTILENLKAGTLNFLSIFSGIY